MLDRTAPRQLIIRVVIVAEDSSLSDSVRSHLADRFPIEVVETYRTGRECLQALTAVDPDVVLIADPMADISGLQLARQISAIHPHVGIVILSTEDTLDYYRSAMASGARAVVKAASSTQGWIISGEDLDTRIHQAYELVRGIRAQHSPTQTQRQGEIIAIYSAKGGVGKSLVATHLALHLARLEHRRQVALVDLNLQFGIIGALLGVEPAHTIADLAALADQLTPFNIESMLPKKDLGDGFALSVVLPPTLKQVDQVIGEHVTAILSALRRHYKVVVVDTTATISDLTLAALQAATRVVLVLTPDVLGIRQARIALDLLTNGEIGVSQDSIVLVINKVASQADIKVTDIASLFERYETIAAVPADPAFFESFLPLGRLPPLPSAEFPALLPFRQMAIRLGLEAEPPRADKGGTRPAARRK